MKTYVKISLIYLCVLASSLLVLFGLSSITVSADIIQSVNSASGSQNTNGAYLWQTLGTGLTGTVSQLVAKYNQQGGSTSSFGPRIYLWEYASEASFIAGSSTISTNGGGSLTNAGTTDITVTTNFSHALNPNSYYVITNAQNNMGSGRDIRTRGSASDVFPEGQCLMGNPGSTKTACTGIADIYFQLIGANLPVIPTTLETHFEYLDPEMHETVASTSFTISADLWFNDTDTPTADQACVFLENMENISWNLPFQNKTLCWNITTSGWNELSTTTVMGEGATLAQWYVINSSNNTRFAQLNSQFVVVESGLPTTYIPTEEQIEGCETPDGILEEVGCWILDAWVATMKWLFAPNQTQMEQFSQIWEDAQNKKPIGYFAQTYTQFEKVANATSSAGTNVVVNLAGLGGEITMIDWATMKSGYETIFGDSIADYIPIFTYIALAVFLLLGTVTILKDQ